ncbi:MAG: hypothetical protein WCI92_01720 [Bacteroidota bacterium]
MFKNIASCFPLKQLLLISAVSFLLTTAGCAGSRNNSQRNWNRTPASTGHSRCGCLLITPDNQNSTLYKPVIYALQA